MEDGVGAGKVSGKEAQARTAAGKSTDYSNKEEVAEWYEGLRLCCDYQRTRELQEAQLIVCCQHGNTQGALALVQSGVSPNGRAIIRTPEKGKFDGWHSVNVQQPCGNEYVRNPCGVVFGHQDYK